MEHIINEAPEVAEAFFSLTKSITDYALYDATMKELILIGIFTASGGVRGIGTHVERAIQHGATKEHVIASILLALPVIGVPKVNLALEKAIEVFEEASKKNEANRP